MAITPHHKPVSGQPVDTYAPINWDFINKSLQQKDVAVDSALAKGQEIQGILAGFSATNRVNIGDTFDTYMPYSSILKEKSAQYNQELENGYLEFQETGNVGKFQNFIKKMGNKIGSDQELQFIQSVNNNALKAQEAKSKVKLPHDNPTNMMPINLHLMQILQGTAQWNNELPPPTQHERDDQLFERINKMAKDVKEKSTESFLKLGVNAKGQPVDHFRNNVSLLGYDKVPGFENVVDVLETYGKYKEVVPFANVYMASMTEMQRHANSFFANKLNSVLMTKPNITVEEAQQIEEALRKEYFKPPDKVPKLGKDGEPVLDKNGNPIMLDDFTTAGEFWQTANDYSNHMGEVYSQFQQSVHDRNISFSGKDGDGSGTDGKKVGISSFTTDITPEIKEDKIIPKTTERITKISDYTTQAIGKKENGVEPSGTQGKIANIVYQQQNVNYALFNHKKNPNKPSLGVEALTEGLELVLNPEYESLWGRLTKDPIGHVNLNNLNKFGEKVINGLMTVMHYDTTSKSYNYYGFLKELGDIANKSKSGLPVLTKAPLIKKAIERGFLKKEDIVAGVENITKVYKDTVLNEFRNLPDNRTDLQASISKINKTFTDMVTEAEYGLVNSKDPNNVKLAQEEQNKGVAITITNKSILKNFMGEGKEFTVHLVGDRVELFRLEYDKETEKNKRVDILKVDPNSSFADNEQVKGLKQGLQESATDVLQYDALTQLAAFVFNPEEFSALHKAGNEAEKGINTTVYFGDTTTEMEKFKVKVSSKKIRSTIVPQYTVISNGKEQEMSLNDIYRLSLSFDGFGE